MSEVMSGYFEAVLDWDDGATETSPPLSYEAAAAWIDRRMQEESEAAEIRDNGARWAERSIRPTSQMPLFS